MRKVVLGEEAATIRIGGACLLLKDNIKKKWMFYQANGWLWGT